MQRFGMMTRVIAVALGVVIAIAALNYASAQQEPPHRYYGTDATPGDTIGVHANDEALTLLGSATVAADGSWYVDIDRDAANGMVFSINGEVANADTMSTGEGQTEVSNLQVPPPPPAPEPEPVCPDDGMMSDDSMMSDDDAMMSDDDAMLDCPDEGDEDDSMMDDSASDDGAMLDEDTSGDDLVVVDEDVDPSAIPVIVDEDTSDMDEAGEMEAEDADEDEGMPTEFPTTGTGGLADGGFSAGLIGLLIALGAATIAGLGIRRVRNRA